MTQPAPVPQDPTPIPIPIPISQDPITGTENLIPAPKKMLSKPQRFLRLLASALDPRAYGHALKLINFYNYSHVQPLRQIKIGPDASISPNATFTNPERIEIGARLRLGSNCMIWGGPNRGRIEIGDDVLFGPDVLVTAANYRFNDGAPVTKQPMDEEDVVIGNDVWLGAKVMVLPGARIGDGAIIGAGAIVRDNIPAFSIAVGSPARVVGERETR